MKASSKVKAIRLDDWDEYVAKRKENRPDVEARPETLAQAMRNIRRESGLSLNEVAGRLDLKTHVSPMNYENGLVSPTVERLREWADIFGYDIEISFVRRSTRD